jgi:hypothetical protein
MTVRIGVIALVRMGRAPAARLWAGGALGSAFAARIAQDIAQATVAPMRIDAISPAARRGRDLKTMIPIPHDSPATRPRFRSNDPADGVAIRVAGS